MAKKKIETNENQKEVKEIVETVKKWSIPLGLEEIIKEYGNPDDPNFIKDNLIKIDLPYPMRASWDKAIVFRSMWVHKKISDRFLQALNEIKSKVDPLKLKMSDQDITGGCHCYRRKCGGRKELSVHSWGVAIDINPHLGQYGYPTTQPQFIVDAFKNAGFAWGGDWKIKDGMHFQLCDNY